MIRFPWWGSVLLAIATYYGCKHGIPQFLGEDHRLADLGQLLAPITAMGFLLLAGKQLYDGDTEDKQKTDQQDMPPDDSTQH